MKLRGFLFWLKVTFIIVLIPTIGYASNVYGNSGIDNWRKVKVKLNPDYPEVGYGVDYHVSVMIKNTGNSALRVPLNSGCHVGYKLLNRQKQIIRKKNIANGSCINFDYDDLVLVPNEYEMIDFYISDLEPGIYRAVFEVPPKKEKIIDFKVLEPVDKISMQGESCGGFPGNKCARGLICNYDGNVPGATGVCVEPRYNRLNFIPKPKKDYVNWDTYPYKYEPPLSTTSLKDNGNNFYNPDKKNIYERYSALTEKRTGYVRKNEFEQVVKVQTGRDIDISGNYEFVRRDITLTALYRTMIRNQQPEDLRVYAFKDSKWSGYSNYIEAAAKLELIDVPESKIFAPDGWLKWDDLRLWLRQF